MSETAAQKLNTIVESRGSLSVVETGSGLPFAVQRMFIVHGVQAGITRGFHAHKTCHQFLVVTAGAIEVTLDDGRERQTIRLEAFSHGLHIPPMIWGEQTYLSDDAVLVVLTSDRYDRGDYISDYAEFIAAAGAGR